MSQIWKFKCKTQRMPYTLSFLDQKLYRSLSFDADIKFPESSELVKKFWILKEYKKVSSDLELSESKDSDKEMISSSSYEIHKRFQGDELIVEIVQSLAFCEEFNYFSKADFDLPTGDEELDEILTDIKGSNFDESVIKAFILDSVLQGNYPQNPDDKPKEEEESSEESSE